jgi:hypothetical protein
MYGDDTGRLHIPEPRVILDISDCSGQIHLDLSITSEANVANSCYKLDVLISELENVRAAFKKQAKIYLERQAAVAKHNSKIADQEAKRAELNIR